MEEGKEVHIAKKDLLYKSTPLFLNNSLNLCYYPNRDSLKYKKSYNCPEVKSILRGTIRFKGYVEVIAALMELGLLDQQSKLE